MTRVHNVEEEIRFNKSILTYLDQSLRKMSKESKLQLLKDFENIQKYIGTKNNLKGYIGDMQGLVDTKTGKFYLIDTSLVEDKPLTFLEQRLEDAVHLQKAIDKLKEGK